MPVFLAALALGQLGCQQPPAPDAHPEQARLVWMFPGVGGGRWTLEGARRAFVDAGVQAEFRFHEWHGSALDVLGHLTHYEANRAQAVEVAKQIVAYREQHAAARIDLVGYSGGGGVAVLVAEELPESIGLRNVLLVQPALSPSYDLTRALRRVDGRLVNLYSPYDWLILGWGTQTFGTIDRRDTAAAGKDGFDLDVAVTSSDLRQKVSQQRWTTEMVWSGHVGNHTSILLYAWNKRYVAPWLSAAEPANAPAATNAPAAAEVSHD